MDILRKGSGLILHDEYWRIYARNPALPPQYVAKGAKVHHSLVAEGCNIEGEVANSIIFYGVTIEKGAVVRDSIIMPGSIVKAGATIDCSILAEHVTVNEGAVVGETISPDKKIAVLGSGVVIAANGKVPAGEMLAADE